MFKFKIVISLIFYFLLSQPLYACELSVRILNYPPLGIKDSQGNWTGSDIDYIKALFDKANCSFTIVESPFARGLKLLKMGAVDMTVNITKTKSRQEYLHFLGPQRVERIRLVSRANSIPLISNWQQMASVKATLVQQRGTYFGEKINATFNANNELEQHLVLLSNNDVMIDLIKKKRADGFFVEGSYLAYQLKTNPKFKILDIHPLIINSEFVHYAFSKKSISKEQMKIFTKAYQALVQSNVLQEIEKKHSYFIN